MTDSVQIREAFSSEIDEIIRQRRGMFQDMGFKDASALDAMQVTSRQFIEVSLADGSYHQWFAETSEHRVVGGVAVLAHAWVSSPADPRPQKAYVLNMYVYPECRNRGIARQLMRYVIDWCRGRGFRSVYLHASEMGRPLYEKLGFKPTNEMRLEPI